MDRPPVSPLAGSSHRASTITRLWKRCSLESLCDCSRQFHGNKKLGRIDEVFAGLVDDANIAFSTGLTVWQHLTHLSRLKVLDAAVFDAQREQRRRLLKSHDLSLENASAVGE